MYSVVVCTGDSLTFHEGMMFSTKDRDNDIWAGRSSARRWHGAWWYKRDNKCNLNGLYVDDTNKRPGVGVTWNAWKGAKYSLMNTEMKIKPYSL